MKRFFFTLVSLSLMTFTSAQKFGAKAGLTFNAGDGIIKTVNDVYQEKGEGSIGYHAGFYAKVELTGLYIQPEIYYLHYATDYSGDEDVTAVYNRIDVPINVGFSVAKLARLQAGPLLSYYLKENFKGIKVENLQQDNFNVGMQLGAGVDVGKLSFDLRYDLSLMERQSKFVLENTDFKVEDTPKLLHLSVAYKL